MPDSSTHGVSTAKGVLVLVAALLVMVACMVGYWSYPFPNGKYPDVLGFIALFFKEALLLAFFAVTTLFVLVVAFVGAVLRLASRLRAAIPVLATHLDH
ncbi:hypothetical protein ACS5PN_30535 [Roseateles sp. NT4]|uniref:hypothetical protein n=1 Tax=Roseateles sp. NT4 TaxID=3453715 RepID=UPI003EEF633A